MMHIISISYLLKFSFNIAKLDIYHKISINRKVSIVFLSDLIIFCHQDCMDRFS